MDAIKQAAIVDEVIKLGNPAPREQINTWINDNWKEDFGGTTVVEIASVVDDLMTYSGIDPEGQG